MRRADRPWLSETARARSAICGAGADRPVAQVEARLQALVARNRAIHDAEAFNLDPAANVMNPRAEAMLAQGLGGRPSLGPAGAKYETGLVAIEEIEEIAAALAARVFDADHAEVRVGSGAMANLYGFLALAAPGDAIIVPPAAIGGHVTHHAAGAAGLRGLVVHEAPVDAQRFTVDLQGLRDQARRVRPRIITLGGSLNLWPHPVAEVRAIADEVGAAVLFDAAHQCGLIAGGVWPNPLHQGAHLMTMSTYKSLAGPPGGLIVTNDAALAQRLEAIAFPGLTANSDAGRQAALAVTLLDWLSLGAAQARAMVALAQALAGALADAGLRVHAIDRGATSSHQFALEAAAHGGGHAAALRLEAAGFLASAIGLPVPPAAAVPGCAPGLRIGTPELVRRGVAPADAPALARLIARGLTGPDPARVAPLTRALRARFTGLHYVRE